jgi:hypothetical protein
MTELVASREPRISVTVRPPPDDDGLLRVDDALQQVLSFLRIAEEQKNLSVQPHEDFEWRLVSATTNTPFTLVAVAVPLNPTVDVTKPVGTTKALTAALIRGIARGDPVPGWMSAEGRAAVRDLFCRNANGIAQTIIDFEGVDVVSIDQGVATAVAHALEPFSLEIDTPARTAHGEIDGRLVAVGRYRNKPALNLRTALYGTVWCVLDGGLVEKWGDEQKISTVWQGKRLTVFGRLIYLAGGKLARVEAQNVRERDVPRIRIEDILDPDFTAGLDPVEYLDRLHEGELG